MPPRSPRPTREQLLAAAGLGVDDVIAPGLTILFCGINPGLYTAAIGHHFGRPGNRFWPALFQGGLTPRLLDPAEERELLPLGYGITNLVNRATATAAEVSAAELVAGAKILRKKLKKFRPRCLAVLGVTAYRQAFQQPDAVLGRQAEKLGGTLLWILPNPSGLNAHYQLPALAEQFRALRDALGEGRG